MTLLSAAIAPADTWVGLLVSGSLTALLSGVIAGVVAYLTVHWTEERGRRAARLVVSQAAALILQRETKKAVDDTMAALILGRPLTAFNARASWLQELPFQLPVIVDQDLTASIERFEGVLVDLGAAVLRIRDLPGAIGRNELGNDVPSPELVTWGEAAAAAIDLQRMHLVQALSAHRAGQAHPGAGPTWALPSTEDLESVRRRVQPPT